jgi:hypothetical protein
MKRRNPCRAPVVTDHALLLYLERVVGIDVKTHRRVVEALVVGAVEQGATALVHDGLRYRIKDFRVTTVVPVKSDPLFPVVHQPGDDS